MTTSRPACSWRTCRRLKPESDGPFKAQIAIDFTPETRKTAGVSVQSDWVRFHVIIPYTAFPPAQQLRLSDLYVMVDVFGPAEEGQKQTATPPVATAKHSFTGAIDLCKEQREGAQ